MNGVSNISDEIPWRSTGDQGTGADHSSFARLSALRFNNWRKYGYDNDALNRAFPMSSRIHELDDHEGKSSLPSVFITIRLSCWLSDLDNDKDRTAARSSYL